jgi:eukaryotic-like serine/threonine-protein kinase
MKLPTLATLPTEPSAMLPTPPESTGRFVIRHEIGRGSNGVVYSAQDPVLNREVAIKAIPLGSDAYFRAQLEANFLNEAKAAGGLNHPHIVTVFDAGKTDVLAYIAMERLTGRDLHDVLATGQQMPIRQAASLMARVADAVHYAHKRGLIHRDIKPSNIFLLRDGKPKVLDFGVALPMLAEADATHKRQLIGTPNYMSPEQALGRKLDPRSDIFSLGAILYELIGGRRAFDGKDIEETLAQVIADAPRPLRELRSDVPQALVTIIEKALAKDVEQRYQTAGELRNALNALSGVLGGTVAAPAPVNRAPTPKSMWQTPAGRALLATGFAAVAIVVVLALRRPAVQTPVVVAAGTAGSETAAAAAATAVAAGPTAPAPVTVTPVVVERPAGAEGTNAAAVQQRAAEPARTARPEARPPRPAAPALTAAAPATGDGTVLLAMAPWGEVLVNGASRGVSPPLARLQLAPGVYQIEVRNGAAPPFRARVEVKPGQTVSLQHRF